jgi:hypothetical protein
MLLAGGEAAATTVGNPRTPVDDHEQFAICGGICGNVRG